MAERQHRCDRLILGAGLTGLAAAHELTRRHQYNFLILERELRAGGLARTETCDGFAFDHAIHVLYTRDPAAAELITNLLHGNLRREQRASYCYAAGAYTEYPYQANQFGLPTEVVVQNILGLIDAHQTQHSLGAAPHFEEWIYRTFGRGIAENFMLPYNRRQWAWDLRDMAYDWIAERVPMPQIADVLRGALKAPDKKYGANREFWYPETGGIESLARAFTERVPAECLRLGAQVVAIDAACKRVTLASGERISYERMLSTLPLPAVVALLGDDVAPGMNAIAAQLKYNVVHTVNIGLAGVQLRPAMPMHWIYFPEETTIFHRLSFPHQFSRAMVPPHCCSIQAEISQSAMRPHTRESLIRQTLDGLVKAGLLTADETRPVAEGGRVRVAEVVTLDPAYVIYDLAHRENTRTLLDYLHGRGIESHGRFGQWEYFNMDQAILSGIASVDALAGNAA